MIIKIDFGIVELCRLSPACVPGMVLN